MDRGEIGVKFSGRRAALIVWVGMIGGITGFGSAEDGELYLPVTGLRPLLVGRDYPEQTRHNDFKIREDQSTLFFVLVSGYEAIHLLVCSASKSYVHYPLLKRKS